MGKGDKKTKRGKIIKGSYGVLRPKKKKSGAEAKATEKPKKVVKAEEDKKPPLKKAPAKKASTAKKTTPKAEVKKDEPKVEKVEKSKDTAEEEKGNSD
jgi:30S ribosomal protein S31